MQNKPNLKFVTTSKLQQSGLVAGATPMDDERYARSVAVQYLVELCDVKPQQPGARRQTTPPRQRAAAWFAGWLAVGRSSWERQPVCHV